MLFMINRFITYLTGLDGSPTKRPIGLLLPVDGEPAIVITRIEEAHIRHSLLCQQHVSLSKWW